MGEEPDAGSEDVDFDEILRAIGLVVVHSALLEWELQQTLALLMRAPAQIASYLTVGQDASWVIDRGKALLPLSPLPEADAQQAAALFARARGLWGQRNDVVHGLLFRAQHTGEWWTKRMRRWTQGRVPFDRFSLDKLTELDTELLRLSEDLRDLQGRLMLQGERPG